MRHGAVVVKNGNVLSVGTNIDKNHPNVVSPEHIKPGCSVHAEVAAMRRVRGDLSGATIYVARVSKAGLPALSRPCSACERAIDAAGIKRVVWST